MRRADLDKLDTLLATVERRVRMRATMTDDEAAAMYARTLEGDYQHPASPDDDPYRINVDMTDAEAAGVWQRSLEDWP